MLRGLGHRRPFWPPANLGPAFCLSARFPLAEQGPSPPGTGWPKAGGAARGRASLPREAFRCLPPAALAAAGAAERDRVMPGQAAGQGGRGGCEVGSQAQGTNEAV